MPCISRRRFHELAAAAPLAAPYLVSPGARAGQLGGGAHDLTLLYTNDFHSAFDPIPAYWLRGTPRLGGAAHLATLIARERAAAPRSFLFDSGDMFTGTLSSLTEGEALLDMMTLLRYDAMGIGNHEFDYGWRAFDRGMLRAPFPILCCNIRHRGTGIRFSRPYVLLERDGVRLGVIGVMGLHAARFTIMPSKVAELEFTDPVAEAAACVRELRESVDLIVMLAHQGLPGPMQTDAENDPEVQRPLDEDLAFCAAVPGIDVYIAAHSHHGLEQPIVHPDTRTLVVQTYGYGTRLGRLRLRVKDRKVAQHQAELLKVWSDRLPAQASVAARVAHYRARVSAQVGPVIGRATARFTRKYRRESLLGSFCAGVMRERGRADVGLTNAGGLRADLPEGDLNYGHVLDSFPFQNHVVTLELPGRALKEALEHGFSLRVGMVQVAGLRARYDLGRPLGARLVDLEVGGQPVEDARLYRVATNSFLAEGGDGYLSLKAGREIARDPQVSEVVATYIRSARSVTPPPLDHLLPA
jgi:2',3'-cyclic-nucleotide 2'-phosphodiesterase (5'-nucleotidase family)